MALEGRLSEFSAAEALMLIAREEKSGRLLIEHSARRLVLHFDRGRVAQGRDPNISPDDTFLQLLREANVVSHEQWKSLATRARERPGRDPIEGLLVMGVASREQLKEWLLMHAQGVMDRILELPDGSFNFVSSPKSALFSVPLAEKTEIMVMEAGRRSDEGKELIATQLHRSGVPILLPGGGDHSIENAGSQIRLVAPGEKQTISRILPQAGVTGRRRHAAGQTFTVTLIVDRPCTEGRGQRFDLPSRRTGHHRHRTGQRLPARPDRPFQQACPTDLHQRLGPAHPHGPAGSQDVEIDGHRTLLGLLDVLQKLPVGTQHQDGVLVQRQLQGGH